MTSARTSSTTGHRQPPPYDELAGRLRGPLIGRSSPDFDQARAVYNAKIDRRPGAIARCADVSDVIACVRFAAEKNLDLAIRAGGHNAGGLGVWDDALVIDLSAMRSTTVDPAAHTVRVDGGCTWGDVDHVTVEFGMATRSGFLASTGVGGTHAGRRCGLSDSPLRSHGGQSRLGRCAAVGSG